MSALGWLVFGVAAVPAAVLGHWLGYCGATWLDRKFGAL